MLWLLIKQYTIFLSELEVYMINQGYIGNYDDKKHNILYNYETGFCREEIEPETLIF